jgi:metabolite-proton symporter
MSESISGADGKARDDEAPATRKEVRLVLASSVVGTTVEWYDFFLYGIAAGIVFNKLYFPSEDPLAGTLLAFATFALGFVARPVGGLIFGHVGDRVGRKTTLVVTMLIMGVATMLIGLVPTYESIGTAAPILLVVLRLAQGIAIGGEWGGAVLMAVEYAPRGKRGLYGSLPQVGLALGLLLGTGVFAGLSAVLDDAAFMAWGWRVAFLLSAVLVLVGMIIRLKVLETPAFRKLEAQEARSKVPAVDLFKARLSRRHIFLGMGSRWAEGVAFNTWAVFAISYGADTLGMNRNTMLLAVMAAAAVMLIFIPVFGSLSDTTDRRRVFAFGVVTVALLAYPAFLLVGTEQPLLVTLAVVTVLGVFYPAMYGPQSSLYAEMFPTRVRYSGISFVYQFSGIFASGLTPLVLTYLLGLADGGIQFVGAYVIAVSVVSTACVLAIRPRQLSLEEEEAADPLTVRAVTT